MKSVANGLDDHAFKNAFKGHSMTANRAGLEEVAITMPFVIAEFDNVVIVLAIKAYGEMFEGNPIALFSVSTRFFDLADHPIVHWTCSFIEILWTKGAQTQTCRAFASARFIAESKFVFSYLVLS